MNTCSENGEGASSVGAEQKPVSPRIARCQLGFWGVPYIRAKFYCEVCNACVETTQTKIENSDEYLEVCEHEHPTVLVRVFSGKLYDVSTGAMCFFRHYVPEKELSPEIMIKICSDKW